MPRINLTQNPAATGPFAEATGMLLMNLAVVEMLTYEYVRLLQRDSKLHEYAKRLKLHDRIEMVCSLVKDRAPLDVVRLETHLALWRALRPHIELRNVVAHNPTMFSVAGTDPSAPPQLAGVLNLRPRDRTKDAELVSLEEINGSVNAVAAIARKLFEDLGAIHDAIQPRGI